MHTDVFQDRNSIFIQLFLQHLPFEIIIMRHSHNIEKIFEKEKKKKKKKEPLFEIEKNTSTYRQQNCNLHMQETKTK